MRAVNNAECFEDGTFGSCFEREGVRADCTNSTTCCDHNYLSASTRLSGNELSVGEAPCVTHCYVYMTDLNCLAYHEGLAYTCEPEDAMDTESCTHVYVDETECHSNDGSLVYMDGLKKLHTLREHTYVTGNLRGNTDEHMVPECHLTH